MNNKIGRRINKIYKHLRLKQDEFAKEIGSTRTTVS